MSKIKLFFQNPEYFITSPAAKGYLDWIPDSIYLKLLYRAKLRKSCNLSRPVLYNEKLQWLKLHDRKPEYARLVDKYEVRAYIRECLGEEYLIPCLGIYDAWEDIDFDRLPDRFVIKCTHDSGSVEICRDKKSWDKAQAERNIKEALKRNYYKAYREWQYKDVKPRIIIEKYMTDDTDGDLKDYKVLCFNGSAELIEVHENRFVNGKEHTQTFYTRNWEKTGIVQKGAEPVQEDRKKPENLDEMLALSERIAANMCHARIDWYDIDSKLYFGEITFYDGSGFEVFLNEEDEKKLGDMIDISKV